MGNMLQFKMGTYEGFKALGKPTSAGTVYVTTDEKALYVDVPKGEGFERIRMGDVIQVKDVAELQSFAPDYSTTALYYVIDKNALMKYDGDGTNHKWKQINSVEAVDTLVKAVDKKVDDLTGVVNTNTAAIGKASAEGQPATGLMAKVEALETADAALDGRLDAVEPKVTTLVGQVGTKATDDTSEATLFERVAKNKSDIADVKATADANESAIAGLVTTVGDASKGLVKDVAGLKDADAAMSTRVDDIETRVEATETAIGTKADGDTNSKSLYARVYDNQKAAAAAQSKANDNESEITGLKGRMDTAEADIDQLQTDVEAVEEALGAKTDAADAEGSAFARIASVANKVGTADEAANAEGSLYARVAQNVVDIEAAEKLIGDNADAIADVNTTAEAADTLSKANADLIGKKTDDADANGSAFARIAKNVADITALTGRVSTAEGDIKDLKETVRGIGDNADAIAGINAKLDGISDGQTVKGLIDALGTDLTDEIEKNINAANAMNFIEGIEEYTDLPTSDVHVGDTYVVLTGFNHKIGEEIVRFNAGDLLVATGTEENGVITSGLEWDHVRTGYIEAHETRLTGADNAIKLFSHLDAVLGSVAFVSSNENLKVAVADNQVTLGLEWGSF